MQRVAESNLTLPFPRAPVAVILAADGQTLKDLWPQYRRLLGYVKPYRTRLAGGLGWRGVQREQRGDTGRGEEGVVGGVRARPDALGWAQALAYASLLPLVMIVRGACDFGATYLMNWVGGRVVNDLRSLLFEHLQSLSLDYFTETQTGELISRATNDVGAVQNSITTVVADF